MGVGKLFLTSVLQPIRLTIKASNNIFKIVFLSFKVNSLNEVLLFTYLLFEIEIVYLLK